MFFLKHNLSFPYLLLINSYRSTNACALCNSKALTSLGKNLPIYIGAKGEEEQGLCTGSENYWCVNKNASEEDIQATLNFLQWVVESDEGRDMLANTMGFVTPFTTFEDYLPSNPLVQANEEYNKAGKTPVSWNFTTMPSENWKNNVGSALLEYAQGTGKWDAVETAFVDGWATEYQAAHAE